MNSGRELLACARVLAIMAVRLDGKARYVADALVVLAMCQAIAVFRMSGMTPAQAKKEAWL